MGNTNNNQKKNNQENHTQNKNEAGVFDKAVDFCKKNVKYIAAAGLFIVLVVAVAKCSGNNNNNQNEVNDTEVVTETEAAEDYAKDAYPKINELISNYYTAYANGDNDTLAGIATPISDREKSYISVFSQYAEGYENISCYTKKGLDESSYIVSVYLEIKFKDVETTAPGLDFFYVRTNEEGNLYIDNLYSQFNMNNEEQTLDPDISALIEEFENQEDVITLQTEVQKKYEDAVASDENLKQMVETTVPDAITVWASEQAAAEKKAEEEKKAAEEEAAKKAEEEKKAAEEEAARKAEEEKKAAEAAQAVTVYAIDKVNVRADANETAEKIGQLEKGSATTRLEAREDGWSRIDYSNGTQGYVKSEYLSTEAPAAEAPAQPEQPASDSNGLAEGTVIRLTESTNIRESMSQDSAKIATAFSGEKVTVVMSYAEGWTKVNYNDKIGYIKTDLLQ